MALTRVPTSMQATPLGKNLIINGCMRVAQRNNSWAAVASNTFTLDRWKVVEASTSNVTVSQGTSATLTPFSNYYLFDVTTADASIAATDYWTLLQRIEGYNIVQLQLGQSTAEDFTFSFWHQHTKAGTYCVSFRNDDNTRSYVAEYTQDIASAWEQVEIVVPGCPDGTWLATTGTGLSVVFTAAVGANFQTAAGSWATGNYLGTSNQVNALDSTANFMKFGNVQLEKGSSATQFEERTFGEELALCQRYYEKSYTGSHYPGVSTSMAGSMRCSLPIAAELDDLIDMNTTFAVTKRATPTVTFWGDNTTADRVHEISTSEGNRTVTSTIKTNKKQTGWPRLTSEQLRWDIFEAQWEADAEI